MILPPFTSRKQWRVGCLCQNKNVFCITCSNYLGRVCVGMSPVHDTKHDICVVLQDSMKRGSGGLENGKAKIRRFLLLRIWMRQMGAWNIQESPLVVLNTTLHKEAEKILSQNETDKRETEQPTTLFLTTTSIVVLDVYPKLHYGNQIKYSPNLPWGGKAVESSSHTSRPITIKT